MSIHKDWTKEDNFSEFEETKKKAKDDLPAKVMRDLIMSTVVSTHPKNKVGAVVEKFKRNATPEQLAALANIKPQDAGEKHRIL